jgi:SAM-dependent methyltransferase
MEQPDSEWWRSWFGPGYLALYDEYLAERTPVEIDRLEALLALRPPRRILDLPCGQGRHAIELARRGYDVTGADLSPYLLGVAEERARTSGVHVRWISADMRQPIAGETFEVVLNLFTSLGYFADEGDDRKVVRAAAAMLAPEGRFILEIINGERVIDRFQEREWFTVGQTTVVERRSIDPSARRMVVERKVTTPTAEDVSLHALRLYARRDVDEMLRTAGFERVDLYGDWGGEPLTPDSLRILAVGTMPLS